MVISLEEINPFECKNAPSRAKSRTNDVTSFRHVTKGKTDIFVNVIYKLIYLLLKYRKYFPRDLQVL